MNGPEAGAALPGPRSRRALLRAGVLTAAGGGAMLVAACGTKATKPMPAGSPAGSPNPLRADVATLNSALDLEHAAIAGYTAGIPLLSGPDRAAAQRFLTQELAHAATLSTLIHRGGGKPNPPRASYDLGHPARAEDVLRLLAATERSEIAAYLDAIPRLTPGKVRSTAASILANEAQHISVLRTALGSLPVPSALLTLSE